MNDLFVIYRGKSDTDLYTAYYDGTNWFGNTRIANQPGGIDPKCNDPVAAAVYNFRLYLVYKGSDSDVLYSCYYDGTDWYGNTKIENQPGGIKPESNDSPSAASYNGRLYLVYKGAHSDDLYTCYYDGINWIGDTKIADQPGDVDPKSDHRPAVCVYNNYLYVVYKGPSSNKLYTARYDGTTWRGNYSINDQSDGKIDPKSDDSPAAAVYKDRLYVIYKGNNSDDLYTCYDDGEWHGDKKIADQPGGKDPKSSDPPGATVYNDRLYLVYKGSSSDDLSTCYYDGSEWHGNKKITDQPGGIDPKSADSPTPVVF